MCWIWLHESKGISERISGGEEKAVSGESELQLRGRDRQRSASQTSQETTGDMRKLSQADHTEKHII
jgi:hypothetical protein